MNTEKLELANQLNLEIKSLKAILEKAKEVRETPRLNDQIPYSKVHMLEEIIRYANGSSPRRFEIRDRVHLRINDAFDMLIKDIEHYIGETKAEFDKP